ncbi:Signal transduction histidine kinase [Streptomyces zhaozhouensis]|uniref:Signal transduction histidine kinase n=1 Tax=Streptomyces zhaozhouensis TaxID=1300267 RepID=A0A286DLX6_9ACTN|nr:sensor histidine kinase [Streptomyces zhaozhouensis]SOD59494.1 Signal transduction histidine kinase [Streptomyces zhaozhouensis]
MGEDRTGRDRAEDDPDARWLAGALDAAFVLLLGGAVARYLTHDADGGARSGWVLALFLVFGLVYLVGRLRAPGPRLGERPTVRHLCWLALVIGVWLVLLVLEPSATWCTMPLLFTGLHRLPVRMAASLAAGLVVLVVVTEVRVSTGDFNPNLVIAPLALGAVATAVLVHSRRLTGRQRELIDELVRTRQELAVTERGAGVLAERERLSAEIHDILAQSLSSQRMLLQAAERRWHSAPDTAHAHVREAAAMADRGLAEVRRFVRDLAPLDLAEDSLVQALRALVEREAPPGPAVEFRLDAEPGAAVVPPGPGATALLRVTQQALANAREHAGARRAVVTLTCLADRTTVDIADDGRGFDVASAPARGARARRGHGIPGMRTRARRAGGVLTVDSAPGAGTVVTLSVPVAAGGAGGPVEGPSEGVVGGTP